jgi:hypothetical protein
MTELRMRRPSPLQRRVLIVLAALGAKSPGPVATRDIERVLEQGGDAPVYGLTSAPPAGAWKPRAGCAPCAPRTCNWPLS